MEENNLMLNGNVSVACVDEHIAQTENRGKTTVQNVNTFNEKNYLNLKLADGENSRAIRIRILPVSAEDGNFCVAIKTHSLKLSKRIAKSGFKSFICLNDNSQSNKNGEGDCPLCKKAKELFIEAKQANADGKPELSKTLYKEACSYLPKETYIVRVIERGKEDEGVKFWRFNANSQHKGYHDDLVALYKNRRDEYAADGIDGYNIFDLKNGRDIILNLTRTVKSNGQEGVTIKVDSAGRETPLSTDVSQANAWINDSKKWQDAYAIKDKDYLAIIADGLIPYKDKLTGTYVGKTEEDFRAYEEKKKNAAIETPQPVHAVEDEPTELPF